MPTLAYIIHAAAGDVHHEVSAGLVPLPRQGARARAPCGVLLKAETAQRRVGSDTKLKTPLTLLPVRVPNKTKTHPPLRFSTRRYHRSVSQYRICLVYAYLVGACCVLCLPVDGVRRASLLRAPCTRDPTRRPGANLAPPIALSTRAWSRSINLSISAPCVEGGEVPDET